MAIKVEDDVYNFEFHSENCGCQSANELTTVMNLKEPSNTEHED